MKQLTIILLILVCAIQANSQQSDFSVELSSGMTLSRVKKVTEITTLYVTAEEYSELGDPAFPVGFTENIILIVTKWPIWKPSTRE